MIELIAEISGNHMGDLGRALDLITAASEAGCTGVKFQCFQPERLAAKRVKHPRLKAMGHKVLQDLYRDIYTPQHWFPDLISHAKTYGLTWHASVFDPEDVNFLETLDCPRYKIASFEAFDKELINAVVCTGKPVVCSVNQHDKNQIQVDNGKSWTILHATDYGVTADKANLRKIRAFADDKRSFDGKKFLWGLSDHTITDDAAIIAVVLGAKMIEWHIKLAGTKPADNEFSWEPETIGLHVRGVRYLERCLYAGD